MPWVNTHGIAPEANFNIFTTEGFSEISPTEAKGGVNLLDAVFRGAAPHHQRRGNVILFDSDLAAQVGTVYARIDETIGFSKTNNLRRIDSDDSGERRLFPQKNLATYMKREATSGEIVLQTNLASSVKVYRGFGEGGMTRGDSTAFTGEDLTYAIINGLYGGGTQARDPGRRDQGGNVVGGIIETLGLRYLESLYQGRSLYYDAFVFPAVESGTDIGLFAGLPIYADWLVRYDRDRELGLMNAAIVARGRSNEQDKLISTKASVPAYEVLSDGRLIFRDFRPDDDDLENRDPLIRDDSDTGRELVFPYIDTNLLDGKSRIDSARFLSGNQGVELTIVNETTGVRTRVNIGMPITTFSSYLTPLPYYLAVVSPTLSTPCGSLAAPYCITAPSTYNYYNSSDTTKLQSAESLQAAAGIVAGGIALLQDVFDDQLNTEEIIERVKRTASQDFNYDGTAGNDYLVGGEDRYGQGMLDLDCASRPVMSVGADARCRQFTCPSNQVPFGNGCLATTDCTTANNRVLTADDSRCLEASTCLSSGQGVSSTTHKCIAPTAAADCMATGGYYDAAPTMRCVRRCEGAEIGIVSSGNRICMAAGSPCRTAAQLGRTGTRRFQSEGSIDGVCLDVATLDKEAERIAACVNAGRIYNHRRFGAPSLECVASDGSDCQPGHYAGNLENARKAPTRCVSREECLKSGGNVHVGIAGVSVGDDQAVGGDPRRCVSIIDLSAGGGMTAEENRREACENAGRIYFSYFGRQQCQEVCEGRNSYGFDGICSPTFNACSGTAQQQSATQSTLRLSGGTVRANVCVCDSSNIRTGNACTALSDCTVAMGMVRTGSGNELRCQPVSTCLAAERGASTTSNMCRSFPNAAQCRAAGGFSDTRGFLLANVCVATGADCNRALSIGWVGSGTSSGNRCVAPANCPTGQGVRNRVCSAINSGDARATKLTECQAAGSRILSSDTNSCRVSSMCDSGQFRNSAEDQCVTSCAANEGLSASSGVNRNCVASGSTTAQQCSNNSMMLLQSGTGCVTTSACRTGSRAVSGMTCIAGTAASCLADGGRGFTSGTGCVNRQRCQFVMRITMTLRVASALPGSPVQHRA